MDCRLHELRLVVKGTAYTEVVIIVYTIQLRQISEQTFSRDFFYNCDNNMTIARVQ